jgi:hypothetical protein
MKLFREVNLLHNRVLRMPAYLGAAKITSNLASTFNTMLCVAKDEYPDVAEIRSLEPVSQSVCLIEVAVRLQILKGAIIRRK